jgi:hypothetical protein
MAQSEVRICRLSHPVACLYASAFHFDPTLPGMLDSTLIGHQVIQVGEAREKGLLTAVWVMESLHHEQFLVDGVMGLIQQGAGYRHLRSSSTAYQPAFLA